MKKKILCILVLFFVSTNVVGREMLVREYELLKGTQPDTKHRMFLNGYIAGMADGIKFVNWFNEGKGGKIVFCVPEQNFDVSVYMSLIDQTIRSIAMTKGDQSETPIVGILILKLWDTFPCD